MSLVDVPMGHLMGAEIAQQPAVLEAQLTQQLDQIRTVAAQVAQAAPRFVVLAGRGTSDHAALYAKYLLECRLGLPCGLASLSTLTGYHAQPSFRSVLWIVVSQSGGSPDAVESTLAAAAAGALTLAVTNDPSSPLAQAADLHIDIAAGPELAVAATKTFTASLQALWLFVDAWAGGDGSAAQAVPGAMQAVIEADLAGAIAERYRFVERLITVGRGYSYPTAREAALKLMETSYLSAHAFSGADLMHGPLAMIDEDRPVLVFASGGVGATLLAPVLERLAERDADVCLIGDAAVSQASRPVVHLPLPSFLTEELAPIVQVVPAQQLARHVALARRHDPDHPRGLRKVTQTR